MPSLSWPELSPKVIASFAGWIALSFGGFYNPGDRVQLGGIRGDVIDIGILRTTLMECGQWVNGDLYNGRIVTLAATDNWLEFTARYVVDYQRRRTTKDTIFSRLLEEVEASEGPSVWRPATVELAGAPELQVRVERS